jgi:hypothetical protein
MNEKYRLGQHVKPNIPGWPQDRYFVITRIELSPHNTPWYTLHDPTHGGTSHPWGEREIVSVDG